MAYRVLVTDKLSEEGLALLRAEEGVEVVVDTKLAKDPAALKEALKEADGIAIRSGTTLTADVLDGQTRLKAIVRAGVGVDNIDVPAATKQGVVVMNTPGGNTVSTAEQTMALMLALARNTPRGDASLKAGKWDRGSLTGVQLEGKTLGVVGLGRVGLAVAQRALGFEMKVLGYDPLLSAEKAREHGVEFVPRLDDLWPRCDFITLHTPLTPETRHVVSAEAIATMKPGVRIINCARGGLIDDAALLEALNSGKVAGAAVDVFETEPPPADDPIVSHPKTVVTPHLGASTEEAQVNVAVEGARLLCDYLLRGQVRCSVNTPTLDRAEMEELRGHLDLAWRLGLLHAQMDRGAIRKAVLTYRGEAASKNTKLLTACFAAGLMEASLAQSVNLVNALPFARERGLAFEEKIIEAPGDFGTLIHAEVTTDKKTYIAAGTLFGKEYLRLVQLGSYQLDAHFDGPVLIFTHQDRPGLIGFLGTTLGDHGVNIAQMNVGRERPGGEAIGVVNLDGIPSQEALDAIAKHPDILSVRVVKLPAQGELPSWLGS
ncbi:phosphoglycerate dehydrogenase [Paludisphaera sp.]|uniref:phosphoglycerate dehydrogenase n=1 Tax=Paludisphaera sp. TaxID=2017432 RepID=UPI00301BBC65